MLAHMLSLLLLAFAVSLDGFGVGVTYGMRKIRIPLISVAIIAFCSGFVIWLSMLAGSALTGYLPPQLARLLGALILIAIGVWALVQLWRGRLDDGSGAEPPHGAPEGAQPAGGKDAFAAATLIKKIEMRRFGLVIQILRTPQAADVDRSGTISASEAVLLGAALSLDAFGAGLGAAMLGIPPLPAALLIAVASGLFLCGGMRLGFRFAGHGLMRRLSVLPGLILIIMGITRLL